MKCHGDLWKYFSFNNFSEKHTEALIIIYSIHH